MNDHDLQHLYERLGARPDPDRAHCLSPEEVMRLAAAEAAESERLAWLEHVSTCPDCRAELDFARAVAEAGNALQRRPIPARWLRLAAALVVLAGGVALWRSVVTPEDPMRGGEERVTLVAPIGTVAPPAAERLVWRAVSGATFEIEVLDGNGAVAFRATTEDTTTLLPVTALQRGIEYRWRVTAVLADGSRRRSAAESLVIH
jgi:hypothetical protein